MPDPTYGIAYTFTATLIDAATGALKASATISAGDVLISKDYGSLSMLANLPTPTPAGSRLIPVSLTATEMQAAVNIDVQFLDVAGNEWRPVIYSFSPQGASGVAVGSISAGAITSAAFALAAITASAAPGFTSLASQLSSVQIDVQSLSGTLSNMISALSTTSSVLSNVFGKVSNVPTLPASQGDTMTLTSAAFSTAAVTLLDFASAIETSLTVRQALRLNTTTLGGIVSGMSTATVVFRNAVANSKTRVSATVDSAGNRLSITYDLD